MHRNRKNTLSYFTFFLIEKNFIYSFKNIQKRNILYQIFQTLKVFFKHFSLNPNSFLGYVDKIGTAYESSSVASGYGAYIAQVTIVFFLACC